MLTPLENFYYEKEEPVKSCLLALKEVVLSADPEITSAWKYSMPFFCYKHKMFCYLWVHKKHKQPYIGFVEGKRMDHPDLIIEKRSRMKIMLFNENEDLPVEAIKILVTEAIGFYKDGLIKIK